MLLMLMSLLQMLTEHALVLSVLSLLMVWAYSLVRQRQLYLFGIEVESMHVHAFTNDITTTEVITSCSAKKPTTKLFPIDCSAATTCHNLPELTTTYCGEMWWVVVSCGKPATGHTLPLATPYHINHTLAVKITPVFGGEKSCL